MSIVNDMKDRVANARRRRRRGLRKQPARGLTRQPRRKTKKKQVKSSTEAWIGNLTQRNQAMPGTARQRVRRQQTRVIRATSGSIREIILSTRWISFIILLMCIFTLVKIGNTERFFLNAIQVEGVEYIDENEIVNISGLRGAHIFAAEPQQAIANVEALPGVIDADVVLQWPDNISIIVEEETPVVLWREGNAEYWVNENGELIPVQNPNFDLLRIVAYLPAVPPVVPQSALATEETTIEEEGELVIPKPNTYLSFVPPELVNGALTLQAEISRTVGIDIPEFGYVVDTGLHFQDGESGWLAHFGTGEDMAHKVAVYQALIADLQARGITPEYVNVSNKERPFYKPIFTPASAEQSQLEAGQG